MIDGYCLAGPFPSVAAAQHVAGGKSVHVVLEAHRTNCGTRSAIGSDGKKHSGRLSCACLESTA